MLLQEEISWLIPSLPLISAFCISVCLISFNRTTNRLSKPVLFILISTVGISTIISYFLCREVLNGQIVREILFINEFEVSGLLLATGFLVDNLSTIMLCLLTTSSFFLIIFSNSFMSRRKGYVRHSVFLGFYCSAIFGLAISFNIFELYLFWLLSGLFSTCLKQSWCEVNNGETSKSSSLSLMDAMSVLLLLGAFYVLYQTTLGFEFTDVQEILQNKITSQDISLSNALLISFVPLAAIGLKILETPIYLYGKLSTVLPRDRSLYVYSMINLLTSAFLFLRLQPIINTSSLAFTSKGIFSIG